MTLRSQCRLERVVMWFARGPHIHEGGPVSHRLNDPLATGKERSVVSSSLLTVQLSQATNRTTDLPQHGMWLRRVWAQSLNRPISLCPF